MKWRSLGRTGMRVPELCLGTMTFGVQCDEKRSFEILDAAREGGVLFLDTSNVYPLGGDLTTVGRTEEILSHAFAILKKLAVDDGDEGTHFRRFHAATVPMALDILVRNSGRDTRGNDSESQEKAALSIGACNFLRASSFDWVEAIELMQTRDAACHCA